MEESAQQRGIKGRKNERTNSIINKIYLKIETTMSPGAEYYLVESLDENLGKPEQRTHPRSFV